MFWRKDNMSIRREAAAHAAVAFAYIGFLVLLMSRLEGPTDLPEVFLGLIMLSLFVFSAAVMAMVFFFKPVAYLLEGKKKEAAAFVGWTMLWFFVYVVCVVAVGILVINAFAL